MVTEIYIRGWKVDAPMMEVLLRCWALLPRLQAVHLWNVALDSGSMALLAAQLPQCCRLRTLVLDGNPLGGTPVSALLGRSSHLRHLSLRFCRLTDLEARGLGTYLGSPDSCNSCLLTLNLSNNAITDIGAGHLATSLRFNRYLVALNLASNRVGDEGAAQLSGALSQFPLTHEQLVRRRQLLSERLEKENICPRTSPRPTSSNHNQRAFRTGKDKEKDGLRRSKEAKEVKEPKIQTIKPKAAPRGRKLSPSPPSDTPRAKKSSKKKSKKASEEVWEDSVDDVSKVLTVDTRLQDGQLWIVGNRTLLSLNLSRNQIGARGMRALLMAIEDQNVWHATCANVPVGLRRLVVHKNAVPNSDATLRAINTRMQCRDPAHRVPIVDLSNTMVTPCSIPLAF
ncbi:leucine-rich repeat-containing protein 71-like [Babylonia areolata]|uniref:leucine-rich repeat-containing protein 71-like n=1 Tax=Babylonia areolata TaxID=304850 RepID=UPI003FD5210C